MYWRNFYKKKLAVLSVLTLCLLAFPMPGNVFALTTVEQKQASEEITEDENENVITVSVVDCESGEIIKAPAGENWNVAVEGGYWMEYVIKDGVLDVSDLCMMKQELIKGTSKNTF